MPLDKNIYVAGAKLDNGKLLTGGGRVLGAVAKSDDLKTAIEKAYILTEKINFDNAYCRKDISSVSTHNISLKYAIFLIMKLGDLFFT